MITCKTSGYTAEDRKALYEGFLQAQNAIMGKYCPNLDGMCIYCPVKTVCLDVDSALKYRAKKIGINEK